MPDNESLRRQTNFHMLQGKNYNIQPVYKFQLILFRPHDIYAVLHVIFGHPLNINEMVWVWTSNKLLMTILYSYTLQKFSCIYYETEFISYNQAIIMYIC